MARRARDDGGQEGERRTLRAVLATLVALAAATMVGVRTAPATAAAQQTLGPWLGTWTFNPSKSIYPSGPPSYKRATCTIEPWEDGVKVTYDLVRTRGGIVHLEWRGKFDGKDYPLAGVEDSVVTNAYRAINERTYDIIQKMDGAVVSTARVVISPDGRTLTTVTPGKSAQGHDISTTTVYDKP